MDSYKIISDEFANSYKDRTVPWGFNGLGYIIYKRTYSKDGEEWYQTIQRCINGAQKIGAKYTKQEAELLFDLIFNLKCNFAGRFLWQLGTPAVERFHANSLLNCWFISIKKLEDFCFIFENLMLGGGVGFSVRREDIHELPRVKKGVTIFHENTKDADFIVPDSRQGWIELLKRTLESYYITGKGFSYSTVLVRGYGEPIKGFGGTASGPQILIEGIEKICKVFSAREEKKLRSIDVLDICNLIGSIVVAGNIRRSSEIALGDPDDHLFIRAKNWSLGNIPNHRAMSNNTIYADSFDYISEDVWKNGYILDENTGSAKGEAYGFFNLNLCQKFGRLIDGPMNKNNLYPQKYDNAEGVNPCGELPLASFECCCLSELYLNNITSKEELFDCARLLYKTQKAVPHLPFIHEETNKIVKKNVRLGLGVTGICQSLEKLEWLDYCYQRLRIFDREWSKERGWNQSIKLTTVKPSGTLSLLAGATPGVHPAYDQYYVRTVRMSEQDKLVSYCRDKGYKIEYLLNFDGTEDKRTVVVSFPCECSNAIYAKNMSAIQQLELVKKLQTVWSDNAVSATVYYKPEELNDIKEWMKDNYDNSIKSVSFLLLKEHGFKQAPYQAIDEKEYIKLKSKVKDLVETPIEGDGIDIQDCATGSCPIR